MAEPNADDGLMPEIVGLCNHQVSIDNVDRVVDVMLCAVNLNQADIFKHNREMFNKKATKLTAQHARATQVRQSKPLIEAASLLSEGDNLVDDDADLATQDTQGAEALLQTRKSVSSDDSFSDDISSNEGESDDSAADENNNNYENNVEPLTKRRCHE